MFETYENTFKSVWPPLLPAVNTLGDRDVLKAVEIAFLDYSKVPLRHLKPHHETYQSGEEPIIKPT